MFLHHELSVAVDLAKKAGDRVRGRSKSAQIRYKSEDESPVTDADEAADKIIHAGLSAAFSNDAIVSEESFLPGTLLSAQGRVWFVDPIDGTSNYIKGGDEYTVMIGLVIDGKPVLGVVYQPATNILWQAIHTADFSLCERIDADGHKKELDIQKHPVSPSGIVLTLSRSHSSTALSSFLEELPLLQVLRRSSVGTKMALIAEGQVDLYLTPARRLKLWDLCAPYVILRAAGGIITGLDESPLVFGEQIEHRKGILATTPLCYALIKPKLVSTFEKWRTRNY